MKIFIPAFFVFAALWFLMRLIKELWEKDKLPGWFSPIGGIIAWGIVASAVGMVWGVADPGIRLFTEPSYGVAFELIGLLFALSMGAKFLADNPEIMDFSRVKPLIIESLQFRKYNLRREDIFEELDKQNIKKVYSETTGKEFPKEMQKKMKPIPHMEPEEALKELERVRAIPLRSAHLQDQLSQLKAGEVADISDSFKLNAVKRKTHDFYDLASEMKITPSEKLLAFKIVFPNVNAQTTFDADMIFRLKQNLYDLLQALRSEAWLKPYMEYFENLRVVCYRTDMDTFGLPAEKSFCSVQIALMELAQRDGKLFVATELDKIAVVTFTP